MNTVLVVMILLYATLIAGGVALVMWLESQGK